MQQLKFKSSLTTPKSCPICHVDNNEAFAHIKSKGYLHGSIETDDLIIRCKNCACIYYADTQVVGYLDGSEALHKRFTDHYFLVGCGIDLGVELLITYAQDYDSLLEVGCGAGYSIDYWSNFKRKAALGLEAAYYGSIGRDVFNIDVRDAYISPSDPPIAKFDVVMSTEVIEHVEDPLSFIAALKNNLSDDGVLILTTPAAEYINQETNISIQLAALSPGLHCFLLSEMAMRELLAKNGFNNVEITVRNERMIVCARLDNKIIKKKPFDRAEYIDYLRFVSNNPETIVAEGAQVRLFKELVNKADFQSAGQILSELLKTIREKYKLDLSMLFSTVESSQGRGVLDEYLYRMPPYIGILFYYMGLFYSRKSEDMVNKLICFGLAYQLLGSIAAVEPQFAQESESLISLAGGEFANALFDNANYFLGYAIGRNAGLNNEFVNPAMMMRLKEKIRKM